jgi:hypothetical protein
MLTINSRRSDRVYLAFPIQGIGIDTEGSSFDEEGRTIAISRNGAVIVLNRKLIAGQELTIRCLGTSREAKVRVVGLIGGRGSEFVYGTMLLDPVMNLWNVEFPRLTGTEKPLARMLLICSGCSGREVVHLDEIEIQVFDATQRIQRFCKSCSAMTPWKQESKETVRGPLPQGDAHTSKRKFSTLHLATAHGKREHNRVKTTMSACIRQSGFSEEIVVSEDLSRGGLCFRSPKRYLEGSEIDIAVPYSTGSGNIFVHARVIRVEKVGDQFKHGAAYVTAVGNSLGYEDSPVVRTQCHLN